MANYSFWQELPKPFFVLAPMADVTDAVFRRIITKYSHHGDVEGGPHVVWTEFVSCDGLDSAGRDVMLRDLEFTEGERPIVAQVFGSKPENFEKAARLIKELGYDGIDINMGCPVRNIQKQCAGAFLIQDPKLAQDIVYATKQGAGDMPVSVKTRVGYNQREIETWIPALLETNIPVLTVHARTRKEMSKVPARWEDIATIVDMAKGTNTLIIGNGDVRDLAHAKERVAETGADGAMLGRAVFGNPWLFYDKTCEVHGVHISADPKHVRVEGCECITFEEKLRVMVEHTQLFAEVLGDIKNFALMKKHYKAYVNGFSGAKEFRTSLMDCPDVESISNAVDVYLKTKPFSCA